MFISGSGVISLVKNAEMRMFALYGIKPSDTIETDTGNQKVSELLRSEGISNSYRKVWPIFSDDEKVLWIPGVRTSRLAYCKGSSKDLLSISGKLVSNSMT